MAKDDPRRAARLAEALRANLRRRKAQARETGGGPPTPDAADPIRPAAPGEDRPPPPAAPSRPDPS